MPFLIFSLTLLILNFHCVKSTIPVVNKFILDTPECKIPDLNQWDFSKFYKKKSYIPCGTSNQLVKIKKEEDRYSAVIDPVVVGYYTNTSAEISCWINNITRSIMSEIPDNEIRESRAVPFESLTKADIMKDVIKVKCYKLQKNETKVIYENVFGTFVPFNINHRRRPVVKEVFNVLMIAIDSLSKYNFVRLMPITYEYLIRSGFKFLHGYGQVARNTLPNIIPLLTGYSMKEAMAKFGNPIDTFFDMYDFVWYDYERNGYLTAYAEDYSIISTFNRQYKGFWSKPTDFYFRSLSISADLLNSTLLDKMPHCSGPENSAERVLNLALDFVKSFRMTPHFGIFWLNSFSHDDFNSAGRMDEKMKEFFEDLRYENNTIVMFFSDHGYYKDSMTKEPIGKYESISPFNFVYLPKTFKAKYKELTEKFEENSKNLLSPFDIYATLQDILVLSETNHTPKKPKSCPKCKSLFREHPRGRTCKDAGIEDDWCPCWKAESLRQRSEDEEKIPLKKTKQQGELRRGGGASKSDKKSYFYLFFFYVFLTIPF